MSTWQDLALVPSTTLGTPDTLNQDPNVPVTTNPRACYFGGLCSDLCPDFSPLPMESNRCANCGHISIHHTKTPPNPPATSTTSTSTASTSLVQPRTALRWEERLLQKRRAVSGATILPSASSSARNEVLAGFRPSPTASTSHLRTVSSPLPKAGPCITAKSKGKSTISKKLVEVAGIFFIPYAYAQGCKHVNNSGGEVFTISCLAPDDSQRLILAGLGYGRIGSDNDPLLLDATLDGPATISMITNLFADVYSIYCVDKAYSPELPPPLDWFTPLSKRYHTLTNDPTLVSFTMKDLLSRAHTIGRRASSRVIYLCAFVDMPYPESMGPKFKGKGKRKWTSSNDEDFDKEEAENEGINNSDSELEQTGSTSLPIAKRQKVDTMDDTPGAVSANTEARILRPRPRPRPRPQPVLAHHDKDRTTPSPQPSPSLSVAPSPAASQVDPPIILPSEVPLDIEHTHSAPSPASTIIEIEESDVDSTTAQFSQSLSLYDFSSTPLHLNPAIEMNYLDDPFADNYMI
ncbi:hypothetical protein RhiJN_25455 [Ceratobasidium sp. AG-Ba]|nr:hypothetical protein RhiJN_25455 [Ceratobasidium sp. AG-Ba]